MRPRGEGALPAPPAVSNFQTVRVAMPAPRIVGGPDRCTRAAGSTAVGSDHLRSLRSGVAAAITPCGRSPERPQCDPSLGRPPPERGSPVIEPDPVSVAPGTGG